MGYFAGVFGLWHGGFVLLLVDIAHVAYWSCFWQDNEKDHGRRVDEEGEELDEDN